MGNHFVPQAYMQSWAGNGPYVIAYSTTPGAKPITPHKKNIANEKNLYPEQLEDDLNKSIEAPMLPLIKVINEGGPITGDDKPIIARYFQSLLHRSPWAAKHVKSSLPRIVQELEAELSSKIDQADDLSAEQARERKIEVQNVLKEAESKDSNFFWHQALDPARKSAGVALLSSMNMAVLSAPPTKHFLTSDRPAMRPVTGIFNKDDGLLLPIGPQKLIVISSGTVNNLVVHSSFVRDVNMRIAIEADKWVISSTDEAWIRPFIDKHRARGTKALDDLTGTDVTPNP